MNMDKSDNNIGFEDIPLKAVDIPADTEETKLRNDSIKKLEKAQIDKQVRAEAGITEIPKEPEQIPKELPQYLFKLGSKAIKCDKFQLDEQEAKLLAKHISILTGNVNSKIFSLIIIVIVVLSKVTECFDAIQRKFGKKPKEPTDKKTVEQVYEETKKAEVTG